MQVAIFDFDGTLYKKETFQLLMKELKDHPVYQPKYGSFFRWVAPRFIAYKLKLYPEAKLKERSMQRYLEVFEGVEKDELLIYFNDVAQKMKPDFHGEIIERLQEHIANQTHVMLVSGAYTLLVQAATDDLAFDAVIGSDISFEKNQVDTARPIHHVNGPRKNEVIHLNLANQTIDWDNSYAYADSYSDLPVLNLVGNPVAVNPEDRLRRVAEKRGWEVI